MKGIILTIIVLTALFYIPAYANEQCSAETLDRICVSEKKPVGNKGHYFVRGQYEDNGMIFSNWVEDSDGNCIYNRTDTLEIKLLNNEYEIYDVGSSFVNSDFKEFGHVFPDSGSLICIIFDDFVIPAIIKKENIAYDPTDAQNTVYYNTDGKRIADIYKFLDENRQTPANGVYYDKKAWGERHFIKKLPLIGSIDAACKQNTDTSRIKVGKTGHWLCGVDADGIGKWIESEDGTDVYIPYYSHTIVVHDPQKEIYYECYNYSIDYGGYFEVINGNFDYIDSFCNISEYICGNYYSAENKQKRAESIQTSFILVLLMFAVIFHEKRDAPM